MAEGEDLLCALEHIIAVTLRHPAQCLHLEGCPSWLLPWVVPLPQVVTLSASCNMHSLQLFGKRCVPAHS